MHRSGCCSLWPKKIVFVYKFVDLIHFKIFLKTFSLKKNTYTYKMLSRQSCRKFCGVYAKAFLQPSVLPYFSPLLHPPPHPRHVSLDAESLDSSRRLWELPRETERGLASSSPCTQNSQLRVFKYHFACYLYTFLAVLFAVSTCVFLCFALENILLRGKAGCEVFHVECQESTTRN